MKVVIDKRISYNIVMFIEGRSYYPTVQVDNEVIWVNPRIPNTPWNFELNTPSELGVFVADPRKYKGPTKFQLGVDPHHGRSGEFGDFKITDLDNIIYREADLKGCGYLVEVFSGDPTPLVWYIGARHDDPTSTGGIWNENRARREIAILEELIPKGLRANRIAALIRPKQIATPDGLLISIDEAKNRRMLRADDQPVIGVRIQRFKHRVEHPYNQTTPIFNAAKSVLEEEMGVMNWQDYLVFYAQAAGQNLGIMHANDFWHGMPSPHNNTLAAELIDFGFGDITKSKKISALSEENKKLMLDIFDYRTAYDTMGLLVGKVQYDIHQASELIPGTHFGRLFQESYIKASGRSDVSEIRDFDLPPITPRMQHIPRKPSRIQQFWTSIFK